MIKASDGSLVFYERDGDRKPDITIEGSLYVFIGGEKDLWLTERFHRGGWHKPTFVKEYSVDIEPEKK